MRLDEFTPFGGYNGFPGYHKRLFSRANRNYIASLIRNESDPVRSDLANWFSQAWEKDQPEGGSRAFSRETYIAMCLGQSKIEMGTPRYQMRHFWYLAELVKNEPNENRRAFLCRWLQNPLRKYGDYFNASRWEDNCNVHADFRNWGPEDRSRPRLR